MEEPIKQNEENIPLAAEPNGNEESEVAAAVIAVEDQVTGAPPEEAIAPDEGTEDIIKYDEDELLVKLVHSYRFLWDPLTKGYKDNDEKKRAWRDISAALNKDVDFLKRRWKNLRDGMMRCLKKENASFRSNSKVPTCRLYNQLIFLKEFFQGNNVDEKLLVSFNGENDNDIEMPDSPHSNSSPTHTEQNQVGRKRSASSTLEPVNQSKYSKREREKLDIIIANTLSKLTDQLKSDEENSNWLFCKSLVGLLGKLSPRRNRLARMEIQQVLMKYEFGDEVPAEEALVEE